MVIVPFIHESDVIQHSVEIYPKEIYLGDTIYFRHSIENISDKSIGSVNDRREFSLEIHSELFDTIELLFEPTSYQYTYNWIPEFRSAGIKKISLQVSDLHSGEKRIDKKACFELPPLEDMDNSFWKSVQVKMTPQGLICRLHVKYYCRNHQHENCPVEINEEILIKPRPKNEMALLKEWHKNTPEKLFPKISGNRKVPHDMDLRSSGKSDITISGNKYDPWLFIRLGNRKPSDPNNPTTFAGWCQLEASLTPSTMRDEVRLTRLQLEYYSAKPGEASENAKNELVEWLKSLPEVQRAIYLTFLVSKMSDFARSRVNYEKPTPLWDKNRELIRTLYDILDLGCQEQAYYNDRSLTPPPGVKVIRPIMEILTPTVEDLTHGTKELPDGFRLWDVIGATGPAKMVGKFVELKESEKTVILKHRENWNINLDFSALSDEDKKYAREQSQRNTAE